MFVIFLCYYLQKCFWPRGRVLGGSNSLNYLVYIRGSRHDYNQWAAEGCKGWSYKDVLPYFLKMEDMEIPRYQNSRIYCSISVIIRIQSLPSGIGDLAEFSYHVDVLWFCCSQTPLNYLSFQSIDFECT